MHIYIDESGIFSNPGNKPNLVSVVAALIIPSSRKVKVFKEFASISAQWTRVGGELKGRLLNEPEIAATTSLLAKYDCLVEANVIDLGMHRDEELRKFQEHMSEGIIDLITQETPEDLNQQINKISSEIKKPRNPIFVEYFLLSVLIPRLMEDVVNYYGRRAPKELQSFHWIIDGKDQHVTDFESAWHFIFSPSIAVRSIKEPFLFLDGGDFSYFQKFCRPLSSVPDSLKNHKDYKEGKAFGWMLEKVLRDFKFGDSKQTIGLQLADIIANAIQRALNKKLCEDGYSGIGRLMVEQPYDAIRLCSMKLNRPAGPSVINSPFAEIINKIVKHAKPMHLDEKQERQLKKQFLRRRKR